MLTWYPTYELFGVHIQTYFWIVAFLVFFYFWHKHCMREKLRFEWWYIPLVVFLVWAGARVWFMWQFPNMCGSGMVSYGAYLGGGVAIALIAFLHRGKVYLRTLAQYADGAVLGGLLAEVVYRLGAYFHGNVIGGVTTVPWGVLHYYTFDAVVRHPGALYLSLNALLVFCLVYGFLYKKKTKKSFFGRRFDGEIITCSVLVYLLFRYFFQMFIVGNNYFIFNYSFVFIITILVWLSLCFLTYYHYYYYRKIPYNIILYFKLDKLYNLIVFLYNKIEKLVLFKK